MRRYSCFSVTGYAIVEERHARHPRGERIRRPFGQSPNDPHTTWYVTDNDDCGQILFTSELEHEAREFCFRANAEERRWEKTREHLLADLEAHP